MKTVLDPKSSLQTRVDETTSNPVVCNIHRSKHEFLIPFVYGKKVLDVGCGAGFGLRFLENFYDSAVGLDGNMEAIEKAKQSKIQKAIFQQMDLKEFDLVEKDFDLIMSVDVIQQIEIPENFLISIKKHLAAKGLFIVITPNVEKLKNINPVHYHEYAQAELIAVLSKFFNVLKIFALEKNDRSARLRFLWKLDPLKIRNYLPEVVCRAVRFLFRIPQQDKLTTCEYPITTNLGKSYSFVAICAQK